MPQFWMEDFAPQIFWLVVSFVVFYFLMSRIALPRIADVLETRQDRIASDLDKAEEHRREAEATLAEYEAALGEARAGAQAVLAEAAAQSAAEAERRGTEVGGRLNREANEAAARIAAGRTQALVEARTVAAELAGAAIDRLIGLSVPADEVAGAVERAMEGAER
jgi:F-type H+-transporting ATPase subunit b